MFGAVYGPSRVERPDFGTTLLGSREVLIDLTHIIGSRLDLHLAYIFNLS